MIEIINGTKCFRDQAHNDVTILQSIQLKIDQGEFVSIMGRSGSGKSTLLHVLGCMDHLSDGEYYFKNRNMNKLKSNELARFRGKHFGFVFQSYLLIKEFTAVQNVETPMGYAGVSGKQRRQRAIGLLRMVGLEDKAAHFPNQLSGGQQQRVAIARALANDPDVIYADEPTGNLDRENGEIVVDILLQLHQKGKTLVLVTHDEALGNMAQRKILLQDGQIVL